MRLTKFKAYRSVIALLKGRVIMSSETFELIYDGPVLSGHQMDVKDLVPALQGLGNLIREANVTLNGNQATVQVLINSEHKRGCFSISVDVIQRLTEAAGVLLGTGAIRTAKDILEWMDLFGMGPKGLLSYLRWRNGREIKSVQKTLDANGNGILQVNVEGDGNNVFLLPPEAYLMSLNPIIGKATGQLLQPLTTDGIDEMRAKTATGEETLKITKEDAIAIRKSFDALASEEKILGLSPYCEPSIRRVSAS